MLLRRNDTRKVDLGCVKSSSTTTTKMEQKRVGSV